METLEEQLKNALARLGALETEVDAEQSRITKLQDAIALRDFGVKPGGHVRNRFYEYLVVRLEHWTSGGKPCVYGKKLRKDGKPSAATVYVGTTWELVR